MSAPKYVSYFYQHDLVSDTANKFKFSEKHWQEAVKYCDVVSEFTSEGLTLQAADDLIARWNQMARVQPSPRRWAYHREILLK